MPTAAGETMLSHARQMLLGAEKIHAELVEHVQRAQGFVRIAANLSAIVQHLPEDLSRFLKARKGVSVDLQDRCCEAVLQAVEDGSVDLGICSCCGASANLHFSPYRKDHLVLAMRHDHQLAKYRKIPFAAALDEEYIVLYGSNWISLGAQAAAHEAGRPLKIKVQVPSFDAICRMAQAGIGIGLIPYEIFAAIGPSLGLAAVELDDAWSTRSQQLIVRDPRQLSPAATALFKHLKESHPNECSRNLGRRHARRRQ
jgi:DNA-binding transcriptional LysR family regulator